MADLRLTSLESMAAAQDLAHQRAAPWWRTVLIYIAVLTLSFFILPNVYAAVVVLTHGGAITPMITGHILANCCANLLVMVAAFYSTGRFDQKLAYVFNSIIRAHGLLALVVVLTHSAYSNRIMVSAIAASFALGLALIVIKHRTEHLRVAMIGLAQTLAAHPEFAGERISDPATDLRRFDLVLTTFDGEAPTAWASALTRAMLSGKPVRHAAEYLEESRGIVSLEHFHVDHLPEGGVASYHGAKRALDLVITLLVAPLGLILVGIGALAVLVTMGRPIFFIQPRAGLGGQPFDMIKLRTMRQARPDDGAATTTSDDDRVTPVGRWLRRYRIDELPQLLHVLSGRMSLIGPRAEWTTLSERYARELPAYAYRQLVRPGITGWAQVRSGYAGDLTETRVKLAYDLFYLKYFSAALDLQILLRTPLTLLTGKGAR